MNSLAPCRILVLIALAQLGLAEADSPEARRIAAQSYLARSSEQTQKMMKPNIDAMVANFPAEQKKQIREQMEKTFAEQARQQNQIHQEALVKFFTLEEIKALHAFESSPAVQTLTQNMQELIAWPSLAAADGKPTCPSGFGFSEAAIAAKEKQLTDSPEARKKAAERYFNIVYKPLQEKSKTGDADAEMSQQVINIMTALARVSSVKDLDFMSDFYASPVGQSIAKKRSQVAEYIAQELRKKLSQGVK